MTIQLAVSTRNARLDAIETDIGTSAVLAFYTGGVPASCSASTTGTKLVEFDLASDWAANASGGSKSFNNTPVQANAVATGTAGYFRVFKSDGVTCAMQGNITATGGGGDLTIDNTSIANGQLISITGFTVTDGNA